MKSDLRGGDLNMILSTRALVLACMCLHCQFTFAHNNFHYNKKPAVVLCIFSLERKSKPSTTYLSN